MDPSELAKSVTARIPTRTNRDDRYSTDTYQQMPKAGYTAMFERMLDHPNIELRLGVDYRAIRDQGVEQALSTFARVDESLGGISRRGHRLGAAAHAG